VIDPYVKVSRCGFAGDKKDAKTNVVKNNGFNPVWKKDFEFFVNHPELDYVLFTVWDKDAYSKDGFIAFYSLPLSCLREGYRTVPLKDSQGKDYSTASLLILVKYIN